MDVLDRFAATLSPGEGQTKRYVRDFVEWHNEGGSSTYDPDTNDDVALRTYLLHLHNAGMSQEEQQGRMAALRLFFSWAAESGLIEESPFDYFGVERPYLAREQIRRRREEDQGSVEEREINHLRALNQLVEQLNRSSDTPTMLDEALQTMLAVLHVQTAWSFLTQAGSSAAAADGELGFVLAASSGLPPGLEQNDRSFLTDPNECHCQYLLRKGQLKRAVNIVECTRLQESAYAHGDNRGLLFHASVPIVDGGQPLGIINVATEEWQFLTTSDLQLLSAIGAQVAIALERARLYDLTNAQRLRLEGELTIAHEVQAGLLPRDLPRIPGLSLAAAWRSAREMAGDFYDVFPMPKGRWAIVIADVSDKGAGAALYMAMTHSLIRSSAGYHHTSPAAMLKDVNQRLNASSSAGLFVTVFLAVLDPETQTVTYANAGQNPPLLRHAAGKIDQLTRTGPLLGVFDELAISDVSIHLEAGDMLVMYTDGVTDALNPRGEAYGVERLISSVSASPAENATTNLAQISGDLAAFTQDAHPFDDITFVLLASDKTTMQKEL